MSDFSLFVTLCAAAVIWTAVVGWSERRFEWRPFVVDGRGTLAGFLVKLYFPKNILSSLEHL